VIRTVVVNELVDAAAVELCGEVPLHQRLLDLQRKVVPVPLKVVFVNSYFSRRSGLGVYDDIVAEVFIV
jgi:hypothetical protein